MPSNIIKAQSLALLFSFALAAPKPQTGPGVFPTPRCEDTYKIGEQRDVEGPLIVGDYTVGGGGSLTTGSTFSVGVTVTLGADISVSEVAGLGLSASISQTTTKTVSQGAGGDCPEGPWKCALAIYPNLLFVKGEKTPPQNEQCYLNQPVKPKEPYEMTYPVVGDSGGVKSRVEVCACKNFPDSDKPGAPKIKCDKCPL